MVASWFARAAQLKLTSARAFAVAARAAVSPWLTAPLWTVKLPVPLRCFALFNPAARVVVKSRALRVRRDFDTAEAKVQAACLARPNSLMLAIEHADLAFDRGNWAQARARWKEVLERFGERAPIAAFVKLSRACRRVGDFDAADAAISAGIHAYPASLDLAVESGEISWARLDFAEAAVRWQHTVDRFGVKVPEGIYLKLSRAYRKLRKLENAHAAASAGLAIAPYSIDLAMERGEIAWVRRNWDEAARCWQAVLNRFGYRAHEVASLRLAHARLFKGDLEGAWDIIGHADQAHSERAAISRARHKVASPNAKLGSLTISIKCAVPRKEEKERWGDYHFAKSLAKALGHYGHNVRIDLRPDWNASASFADDVAIVLRGLTPYIPLREQINICWLISHPELCEDTELEFYDHVFVASTVYAETLGKRLSTSVSTLLQCSDPSVFHPTTGASAQAEELLFIGNSRGQRRKIVIDALGQNLPLAVYGRGWNYLGRGDVVRGEHIPNEEVHTHYAAAKIVLNDHWPDMAANGFVSNRIFDIALSGGFVISDKVVGAEQFEETMVTYESPKQLRALCERWLPDDEGRRQMAARLRDLVVAHHTFDHRAAVLHAVISEIATNRRSAPGAVARAPMHAQCPSTPTSSLRSLRTIAESH